MVDELILQTGIDIPYPEANLSVHQPSIKEIGYIGGDTNLFLGCEIFRFSKNKIPPQDRKDLESLSDFDIIMSIMKKADETASPAVIAANMLLLILFPDYTFTIENNKIIFKKEEEEYIINDKNYYYFIDILTQMFCLEETDKNKDYVAAGNYAQQIIDKINAGRKRKQKNDNMNNSKSSIFSRYISILSVGLSKDKNVLSNYTVWQLFDEMKRYELKNSNDIYLQAKLAGATGMKDVDNWMGNIYDDKSASAMYI